MRQSFLFEFYNKVFLKRRSIAIHKRFTQFGPQLVFANNTPGKHVARGYPLKGGNGNNNPPRGTY